MPTGASGSTGVISRHLRQQTDQLLVWVVDGQAGLRMDVLRSDRTPTREGSFRVGWKSRHHFSSLYDTSMPYAMFFSGGQAVHYSPDFAARGYNGLAGCVNVRNLGGIQALFAQARVGRQGDRLPLIRSTRRSVLALPASQLIGSNSHFLDCGCRRRGVGDVDLEHARHN